jgi:predicted DNA binding protein
MPDCADAADVRSREHTIKEIADTFGLSHMTIYQHLGKA